jgi:hypothetical protein
MLSKQCLNPEFLNIFYSFFVTFFFLLSRDLYPKKQNKTNKTNKIKVVLVFADALFALLP